MKIKKYLGRFKKTIAITCLDKIKYIHHTLLHKWILNYRSEPLISNKKLALVFSPHQDDETLGCGGMIAIKREQGIPVAIVFLTDGHSCGGSQALSKENIITIRKREAIKAASILGVAQSEIHFLDKPDGKLQYLDSKERKLTTDKIIDLLKLYQPEEVYIPHHHDNHDDHEATYELVQEAIKQAEIELELLQYPIWLFWCLPFSSKINLHDIESAYRLSISSVNDKKNRAIASYSSQLKLLPHDFVKLFLGTDEIFFKVKNRL